MVTNKSYAEVLAGTRKSLVFSLSSRVKFGNSFLTIPKRHTETGKVVSGFSPGCSKDP